MLCLIFFAFTTILGWNYYGERCLNTLPMAAKQPSNAIVGCISPRSFSVPIWTVAAVWTIADIFNALMALPNIVALLALSGVVAKRPRQFPIGISNTVFAPKSIDAAHILAGPPSGSAGWGLALTVFLFFRLLNPFASQPDFHTLQS